MWKEIAERIAKIQTAVHNTPPPPVPDDGYATRLYDLTKAVDTMVDYTQTMAKNEEDALPENAENIAND